MKTTLFLSVILLLVATTFTQAQSKKDLETDYAKCITARDSLQEALTGLSAVYDSINKVCIAYDTMYSVIKKKVILHDFDPANAEALIDSLATHRESIFSGLSTSLNDSIAALHEENTELKASLEILKAEAADKTKLVNDLKQLKELLDSGIITQEEFDAKKARLLENL
ncbi:MAG TPA: SHOCT domain-containing protein [Bacteroidales bacterium]|nr:SHOCT domain-containing protein [Bacteroidales bacterium]HNS45894.1 SHOCT domain-containing protein [Bacteroidales bacterium]